MGKTGQHNIYAFNEECDAPTCPWASQSLDFLFCLCLLLFSFFLIYIYEKEGNTLGILIHKYREHLTYRVLTLALGLLWPLPY